MSLDLNRIVDVQISVSPLALQRAGFGILNIVGISDVIPLTERVRAYNSITDVAADFAVTDEEYLSSLLYFNQSPRPQTLYISRRDNEGSPALLTGSTTSLDDDYQSWGSIRSGNFAITVDGVDQDVGLAGGILDFFSVTDLNDVADVINSNTDFSNIATCSWDGEKFLIESATSGDTSTITFAAPIANPSGDDISGMLGMLSTSDDAFITQGVAGETISESLTAIEDVNSKWYGFSFTSEVRDDSVTTGGTIADCLDAAAWAEARVKLFCNNSSDADTLVAGNTTNISYQLDALGYNRSVTVYNAGDYPAVSMFARGATVDFDGTNTTITYKFKQMPGIVATDLSATKANNLIDVNCNYYAEFGTQLSGDAVSMLAEGVVSNGRFLDEVVGIDWLQNSAQTAVFNYLFQSTTKIPQTDEGVSGISQVLAGVLDQAVNNGLLAPGEVVIDNDTVFLPKGYEIFQGLVEDQSQSDREARKAPPIAFIAKGAGAIHSVTISGTFVR